MFNSFHLKGVEAFNKQDYQAAKNLFLQAIDKNPEVPESYLFLGKSYFFCDEKSEAIVHIKKYIKLNPNELVNVSFAFDLLAQYYEAINQDNKAILGYITATEINPLAASAWHNCGLLLIKLAQRYLEQDLSQSVKLFQKAQTFLKKALEICSDNPMFLNSVASWHEKFIEALEKRTEEEEAVQKNIDDNFKLAIEYYKKALMVCREDDDALKNIITANLTECLAQYGHHLYKAENFVKALELYLQAIKLDPDHLVVINQIGMCFSKQNLFSDARKYFVDILYKTTEPQEWADAWLNIACTHRLEKSWVGAENALTTAKMFAPKDPCILEEEKKLLEARAAASLIGASQTIFSTSNTISPSRLSSETEEMQIQYKN